MDSVNRTLYIPLYGKRLTSKAGIILSDPKAEEIWEKEGFRLSGKAKSKWLAYEMSMRARVIDDWLRERLLEDQDLLVLHIGCGLDSRCSRISGWSEWFDVDLPSVIEVRRKYYPQTEHYHMLGTDALGKDWLDELPSKNHIAVVMEGISMYLPADGLKGMLENIEQRYPNISLLMDAYTEKAVKLSRIGNPIKAVGATACTGIDRPEKLNGGKMQFLREFDITPEYCIRQLPRLERHVFQKVFAGKFAKSLYRLYEYSTER